MGTPWLQHPRRRRLVIVTAVTTVFPPLFCDLFDCRLFFRRALSSSSSGGHPTHRIRHRLRCRCRRRVVVVVVVIVAYYPPLRVIYLIVVYVLIPRRVVSP